MLKIIEGLVQHVISNFLFKNIFVKLIVFSKNVLLIFGCDILKLFRKFFHLNWLEFRLDNIFDSLFGFGLFIFFRIFVGLNLSFDHVGKEVIFKLFINTFLTIKIESVLNFFDIPDDLTGFKICVIDRNRGIGYIIETINNTLCSVG
jgi:hypothetical protein